MIKHPCLLPISSCWQSSKERANPSQACSQELFPACITNKIVFNWNRGVSSWMNAYVVQLVETLCVLPPPLWLRFAMVCTSSYFALPVPSTLTHTLLPPLTCCLCGGCANGSPRSEHGGRKGVEKRAPLHCGIQWVSVCVCEGKEKKGLECHCHASSGSSCHQQY